ncbi:MAG: amidohydrolase family protein [Acidobacteria bacterium]|nr:amidohydrolase family protein [Acidobacteriota bacterium]
MLDLVVKSGLVVYGSGRPGAVADIGISRGRIVAIGKVDEPATEVIDADGRVVAPGAVDIHTHYDAQLFWDGAATPSCLHGVTTVVGGNCGFSIAPLAPGQADYLAAMLARVEGIPLESLTAAVPWSWRSFGDYLDALDGRVAVNVGFLAGHTALRRFVMGDDDARPATALEVERLEVLLSECLAAGALGLSSSRATSHNDAAGRAVSSRFAEVDELLALCSTTGRHEGTTLEFIPSVGAYFSDADMELMTAMSLAADRPLNWNILNVNTVLWDGSRQRLTAGDHAAAQGGRVVALTMPTMATLRINFVSGFILDTFAGWDELFRYDLTERARVLADPSMRRALQDAVTHDQSVLGPRLRDWGALVFGQCFAPSTRSLEGRRVADVAAERAVDPFDCLLDVVLADELRTVIIVPPIGNDAESWQLRAQVWRDPRAVIGGSDSGAHLDMIDNFAYTTSLLGPIVRDGLIELEQAVRLVTDVPARLYGVRGRGGLVEGWQADIVVFDPDTIGPGRVEMRADLPGGASRLFADAVGIDAVLVNGTTIVRDGVLTGARPGTVLRSGRDTETVRAAG